MPRLGYMGAIPLAWTARNASRAWPAPTKAASWAPLRAMGEHGNGTARVAAIE